MIIGYLLFLSICENYLCCEDMTTNNVFKISSRNNEPIEWFLLKRLLLKRKNGY